MKATQFNSKELVLELTKDGFRRMVYRTVNNDGSVIFLEESDLVDYSRPLNDSSDFNVFFSAKAFWRAVTEYTDRESFENSSVWHQHQGDWLTLEPALVHDDIKPLIQESLAEAIRNVSIENRHQVEGIRHWLCALSQPATSFEKLKDQHSKLYRHAV